jgi:hypothetical protein
MPKFAANNVAELELGRGNKRRKLLLFVCVSCGYS